MSYIKILDKAIEEIAPKEPKTILMNSRTFGMFVYELTKIYPENIFNPSGAFFYRGIQIIQKNEIQNDKFLMLC
jgi:hypothetical protein